VKRCDSKLAPAIATAAAIIVIIVAAGLSGCGRSAQKVDSSPSAPGNVSTQGAATAEATNAAVPMQRPRVTGGGADLAQTRTGLTARPEATPLTRELVAKLSRLDLSHGAVSAEQAATWKATLEQLVSTGPAGAAAIREFLEKGVDLAFDSEADRKLLNTATLRLALIDTLQKIGGPEAMATSLDVLQRTADPIELATLTKYLDQNEPGKHRDAAVAATKEALALAATAQWDGRDIAPLLEIMKYYGGPGAVAEIQKASGVWFNYAPIVLAEMPEGAGVGALVDWAKKPDAPVLAGNELYLRMLAQVAARFPEAMDALLEQSRVNRIPTSAWAGIAEALGGARLQMVNSFFDPLPAGPRTDTRVYHISAGNQTFIDIPAPSSMTADQVASRLQLIDQLLPTTQNPFAVQALEEMKKNLTARLK
jgi:hypothetical protein